MQFKGTAQRAVVCKTLFDIIGLGDALEGSMGPRENLEDWLRAYGGSLSSSQTALFDVYAGICWLRTVLRESMKVLADKGMLGIKPRAGTYSRPRSEWRQRDPDILGWHAELHSDARFPRDLCEVRSAMEPTAAGFAAVRATPDDPRQIESFLRDREAKDAAATPAELIDLDLRFHLAVVAASHNPLLIELSRLIRQPFRTAMACSFHFRSSVELSLQGHRALFEALSRKHPMAARRAAEQVVGFAMLAVEKAVRSKKKTARPPE